MAKYWLGEVQLDRWVFRSLRTFTSADTTQLTAEVRRRLREEDVVTECQILPDENDVWCALQRLTLKKKVVKYNAGSVHEQSVRYQIDARK